MSTKVSIINARDYPAAQYTHYWEIQIARHSDDEWHWRVRFMPWEGLPSDSDLMQEGFADSEDYAREASQQWVLGNVDAFKRE